MEGEIELKAHDFCVKSEESFCRLGQGAKFMRL